MSAKGRAAEGYVPDPHGFFATQPQVTRAVLSHLGIKPGMTVLEPSCGKGAIGKVLRQEYGGSICIVGIEIDRRRATHAAKATVKIGDTDGKVPMVVKVFDDVIRSDFYKIAPEDWKRFDVVLTNPDFGIWLPFAEHCFKFGPTTLLLPLNTMASKQRAAWWREHPAHFRILSKRPSFAISVKCVLAKKKQCGFQELIPLDAKPKKVCPLCDAPTETTRSDASEYAWVTWGESITRGLWDTLETPE